MSTLKNLSKNFLKLNLLLFICIIVAFIALCTVYTIPISHMKTHVAESKDIFDNEGDYPSLIHDYPFTRLDNFTDSIMLGNAIYDGPENFIYKAIVNYRMQSDELGIVNSTTHYANDIESNYYQVPYARYWHGYLMVLKPLLLFFNYGEIRILNSFMQISLLMIMISLILNSPLKKYTISYILAIAILNPLAISLSLQFSSVYYIFLTTIIIWIIVLKKEKLYWKNISMISVVLGCITSYVDFLTYPIVILGTLLLLYIQTFQFKKTDFFKLLKISFFWSYGYLGMWSGKWIIGSIIFDSNLFLSSISHIRSRSSIFKGTRWSTILRNLEIFNNEATIFLLSSITILSILHIIHLIWKRPKIDLSICWSILAYCVVALIPFVWIYTVSNHSYIHFWFVYRVFAVTVLSFLSIFTYTKNSLNKDTICKI